MTEIKGEYKMAEQEIVKIEQEIRLGIIPARTPHDVIVQASSIAKELAKLIKDNHLSKPIQGREYVYVEGWSTMGAMLGVLPREVSTNRLEDGSYEATVELIRITDTAVVGRASALVGMDEKDNRGKLTWGSRPEYARRSMAVTRATGKAYRLGFSWIMGLAGYAPTPAEEMDFVDGEYREVDAKEKAPIAPPSSLMTLEMAISEIGSDGVKYGDKDTKTLANMANALAKKLKDNGLTPEEREEKQRKLDACRVILADRQEKP
jgi:hypothetical protein